MSCVQSIKESLVRAAVDGPGVDGKIILKWIFERLDGGLDWIDLVYVKNRWRTLVNAVMKIWVP
jgi:hypothetical protein